MAVKIRLARMGSKKRPYYRIVAADARSPRDGRFLERIGTYDPHAESIVLDETSYYQRLNFDTPLDIKLRNDVLSNSVLFIGYSLTDFNIRLLFYRLTEMWGKSPLASARPQSYVVTSRPNPAAEEVLRHWGIEMIVSDEDDPKTALTAFLEELVS